MTDKLISTPEQEAAKQEKVVESPQDTQEHEPLASAEQQVVGLIGLGGNEDTVLQEIVKVETEHPKVEPAIVGEGRPAKRGMLFFRWSTLSDLGSLANGIHLPNSHLGKEVYNSGDQPGTYFSYLGDESTRNRYIAPVDNDGTMAFNWPAFKPEDQFKHRTDEKKGNPRYAVAMILRVTDQNFDAFSGKIGEVEKKTDGSSDVIHPKTDLNSFATEEAYISTEGITADSINDLGSDIKVVVYDREAEHNNYNFMTWAEARKLAGEKPPQNSVEPAA